MGDFTDRDRNMMVQTHTLVKSISDDVKDHEKRIRKSEGIIRYGLGMVGSLSVVSGAVALITKKFGG